MLKETDYWEPEIETMPLEKLRQKQEESLRSLVKRAYHKVTFYRKKFDELKINPQDINGLEALTELPLTRYLEDFVVTPLEDKLAVPWESITEIMTTSGTLSGFTQPIVMTDNDVEMINSLFGRCVRMAGVGKEDIIQLLGPFDSFLPVLKKLSSKVIPSIAGRMILDNQIMIAKSVGTSVIFTLPSYLVRLCERARELGIDLRNDTAIQIALGAGEPFSIPVKKRIEAEYGIYLYDMYGFSESAIVAGECRQRDGLHIWADHFLSEVIDPETLRPLSPGEEGELVITTLKKEAMPLIRYRTGDLTRLLDDKPCGCGRTHPKIAPIRGRVDHIIRIQGTKLLPSDIEDFIVGTPMLGNEYRIIADRKGELDILRIKVEQAPGISFTNELREEVEAGFHQKTSLRSQIEVVPHGTLQKTQFKAQRIISVHP